MEYAALALSVLALLLALAARAKAGNHALRLDDLERDLRRQGENLASEVEDTLNVLRKQLADTAEGRPPSRSMIEEGRLWRDVTAPEAEALFQSEGEVRVIDVRTPQEMAGGILPGALLIPIDALENRLGEIPKDGRDTLVYCAAGGRSAAACELLSSLGYANLHNLEGGFGAWTGPVAKP